MATIRAVETISVQVPLPTPVSFATRRIAHRNYALVRIHVDDGTSGIGFCYEGNLQGGLTARAIHELLAPLLVGEDPHLTEAIWSRLYDTTLLHGRAGLVLRGISAVDIALWDRNARASELPLWQYMGGAYQGAVPAYASGGYYVDGPEPAEEVAAREAASHVSKGFTAIKVKVGRFSPKIDEARLAAIREEVGFDIKLMLDANNAWRYLPSALRALSQWEEYDPYWIEEPFAPDDLISHAQLRNKTRIPVATGEIEAGRWRHLEILRSDAADYVQTDAAVCGGISEFRKIAATASSFSRPMCPHWFHQLHAHLVASTPNAIFVEYFPDHSVFNFGKLLDQELRVLDGEIVLPEASGLGFEFDLAAVSRHEIQRWKYPPDAAVT